MYIHLLGEVIGEARVKARGGLLDPVADEDTVRLRDARGAGRPAGYQVGQARDYDHHVVGIGERQCRDGEHRGAAWAQGEQGDAPGWLGPASLEGRRRVEAGERCVGQRCGAGAPRPHGVCKVLVLGVHPVDEAVGVQQAGVVAELLEQRRHVHVVVIPADGVHVDPCIAAVGAANVGQARPGALLPVGHYEDLPLVPSQIHPQLPGCLRDSIVDPAIQLRRVTPRH